MKLDDKGRDKIRTEFCNEKKIEFEDNDLGFAWAYAEWLEDKLVTNIEQLVLKGMQNYIKDLKDSQKILEMFMKRGGKDA